MSKKQLIMSWLFLALIPLHAHSDAGRICMNATANVGRFYLEYRINSIRGNEASLAGMTCLMEGDGYRDCFPSFGSMISENGVIEISSTGSSKYEELGYPTIYGYTERYTTIDPVTMTGSSIILTQYISEGKLSYIPSKADLSVIQCAKLTSTDKANAKNLRKFVNDAQKIQ